MVFQGFRVSARALIVRNESVLLVEYDDENGLHYNLPGGSVDRGESLHEALRREVLEEICADTDIKRLALVWEYVPSHYGEKYGPVQSIALLFRCDLAGKTEPHLPDHPDPNQTGVRWIPLSALDDVALTPAISEKLIVVARSTSDFDPLCDYP